MRSLLLVDLRLQHTQIGQVAVLLVVVQVILVSHSIEQIERMCSKVAWLSHGHLKMNGDTETVCNAYKAVQRGEA